MVGIEYRRTTKEGLKEKQLMDLMLSKRKAQFKRASLVFTDKQFQRNYIKKLSRTKSFNKDLDFMKQYYLDLKKSSNNMFQEKQEQDDFFQ
jgi:hypothetical protein